MARFDTFICIELVPGKTVNCPDGDIFLLRDLPEFMYWLKAFVCNFVYCNI